MKPMMPSRSDPFPELGRVEPRRESLECKILQTERLDTVSPKELRDIVQWTRNEQLARFLLQDPNALLRYMLSSYGNHFGDHSLRELRESGLKSDVKRLRRLGYPSRPRRLCRTIFNGIDNFGVRCLEACFGKEEEQS